MTRPEQIDRFLAKSGWGAATRAPLAGDASNRRYERLAQMSGDRAVLMDAPPDKNDPVDAFVQIARYLGDAGFSAPRILATDAANGLLLIEDLGDDLIARLVDAAPDLETPLYHAATDVLIRLHQMAPPTGLTRFDANHLSQMLDPFFEWYLKGAGVNYERHQTNVSHIFHDLLLQNEPDDPVLILRDYHAENLLWLPNRKGVARIGLLDFQDAVTGHPAYDLVSLLQDARRDVSPKVEADMITYYIGESGLYRARFESAYYSLGIQRNMRILGVFARLSLQHGKPHYIDYVPRLWGYLKRSVQHPQLAPLRSFILNDVPEPTASLLKKLKTA